MREGTVTGQKVFLSYTLLRVLIQGLPKPKGIPPFRRPSKIFFLLNYLIINRTFSKHTGTKASQLENL